MLFARRGLFAEALELTPTAATTEGPFYPGQDAPGHRQRPADRQRRNHAAVGEVSHLTGRVLTMTGQPVGRNAFVEIWQVDSTASYKFIPEGVNPPATTGTSRATASFLTDSRGRSLFPHHQADLLHADRHLPDRAHSPRDQQERQACPHDTAAGQRPSNT